MAGPVSLYALVGIPNLWEGCLCSKSVASICSDIPSICLKVASEFLWIVILQTLPNDYFDLWLTRVWGLKHTSLKLSNVVSLEAIDFFSSLLNRVEFFLSSDTTHHLVFLLFNTVN